MHFLTHIYLQSSLAALKDVLKAEHGHSLPPAAAMSSAFYTMLAQTHPALTLVTPSTLECVEADSTDTLMLDIDESFFEEDADESVSVVDNVTKNQKLSNISSSKRSVEAIESTSVIKSDTKVVKKSKMHK